MPGLRNMKIECSYPLCPNSAVTDDKGELPPGWDYRLAKANDEGDVIMLPICPDCANLSF